MGIVQPDFRQFTKAGVLPGDHRGFHASQVGYEGRLSVVSESQVHQDGLQRYLVQARLGASLVGHNCGLFFACLICEIEFTSGELSRADGVGFVFSQRLPCTLACLGKKSINASFSGRV